jgi:hypothetical protein
MGLGKMLAGIFKKDEVEAVQAGRISAIVSGGVRKDHILKTGLSAVP